MTIEQLTTAMYERAADQGRQTNAGPDPVAFQMEALVADINFSTAIDDTVRADFLLTRASLKYNAVL
jgi:hypothetical protein